MDWFAWPENCLEKQNYLELAVLPQYTVISDVRGRYLSTRRKSAERLNLSRPKNSYIQEVHTR